MNALPQPEYAESPPTVPSGHIPRKRSHLAIGGGHEGIVPTFPSIQRHDDRVARVINADQQAGERNRGQSERDSANINGAHSAIESNPQRKTQTKQENSLNYRSDDDGVPAVTGEGYEGRHRITQSLCQHFESCLELWTWEHYLCGATCGLMTFLLVLEVF